jgi:hypothetical protein
MASSRFFVEVWWLLWCYGSWIYNYLFNQCLSPLMLRVWISIRARCTTLCDKVVSDLRQVCGFLRFPLPIKLTATALKYCWQWHKTPSNKHTNCPIRGHYIILIGKQINWGENRWHPLDFSLKPVGRCGHDCLLIGVNCNNVAPVTNLCLWRATTRSHSSQWSKKKVAVET